MSSIITAPIWGFKLEAPLFLKSKPKPVEPIVVLSEIITLFPIIEFLITTLFLINVFLPISTPLQITQFLPTSTLFAIFEYFEI